MSLSAISANEERPMPDYAAARALMVESQLRTNRIEDPRVLSAMRSVPRELFVPPALRGVAYADEDLALGSGRRLIEPLVLAKLLQAATIAPDEAVLVLGCDTGYTAAVAGRLSGNVTLLVQAEADVAPVDRLLSDQGVEGISVQAGSLADGLPGKAPFNVILLAGSVRDFPLALTEQLADRGRLVAVVLDGRAGRVTVGHKVGGAIGTTTPYDAWIPELPAFRAAPGFQF